VICFVLLPPAFVTVKVTVYTPTLTYWWVAFWVVAFGEASPKFHCQDVPASPSDVSLNCMVSGTFPDVVLAVKLAIGAMG
jgi:hypothetical protein